MSPESPPTMGSHPLSPPPNMAAVHDMTSPNDITIVQTSTIHMMEDKQIRMKKRTGDPDGIALGKLVFQSHRLLIISHQESSV